MTQGHSASAHSTVPHAPARAAGAGMRENEAPVGSSVLNQGADAVNSGATVVAQMGAAADLAAPGSRVASTLGRLNGNRATAVLAAGNVAVHLAQGDVRGAASSATDAAIGYGQGYVAGLAFGPAGAAVVIAAPIVVGMVESKIEDNKRRLANGEIPMAEYQAALRDPKSPIRQEANRQFGEEFDRLNQDLKQSMPPEQYAQMVDYDRRDFVRNRMAQEQVANIDTTNAPNDMHITYEQVGMRPPNAAPGTAPAQPAQPAPSAPLIAQPAPAAPGTTQEAAKELAVAGQPSASAPGPNAAPTAAAAERAEAPHPFAAMIDPNIIAMLGKSGCGQQAEPASAKDAKLAQATPAEAHQAAQDRSQSASARV